MKTLPILILTLFSTISAMAQPWSEPTAGNIYYNQGNVGIGTANPVAKLEIKPTSDGDVGLSIGTGGMISGIINTPANMFINADTNNGQGGLGLIGFGFNRTGFTGGTQVMTIKESGNIGIGTTLPSQKLDVAGNIALSAELTERFIRVAGSYGGAIRFRGNAMAGNDRALQFGAIDGNNVWTSMMTVDTNSGNIGIGTTTPEAKLTVKGKIVASEIQVKDILSIADYVFKPDYQLMSLDKVEDFVKQNRHLPEVPSEKEFKKEGMNVAEMNVLLLKKVEELTLYVIEQNKKIESLEKTVNNLISK